MKEKTSLELEIERTAKKFLEKSEKKEIQVVSHFDTDGITSATIMIQTLKRLDKIFSVKIIKLIQPNFIETLPKDKLIIFLDLASSSFREIKEAGLNDVFIIDHHEVSESVPEEITIINTELNGKEKISSSVLTYLFCKEIDSKNKDLAKLAALGLIGDQLEKNIDKIGNEIFKSGDIKRKRGLLIFPSTRPINKVLEYCADPYIPGVTGEIKGVLELLRETGLNFSGGKYRSLIELNEEEMSRLVTAIFLRNPKIKNKELIGDIFLIKLFNKLEDARELSAIVNACSRLGDSELAIQFCMEMPKAKKKAECMYTKYRQVILSALKFISESKNIEGNGFVIINAKDKIQDTIIGTVGSILANSSIYDTGTIITTMAYDKNNIKISMRSVGKPPRNLKKLLEEVVNKIGGQIGGHEFAAGALIAKNKELEFVSLLKKSFEIELIKI